MRPRSRATIYAAIFPSAYFFGVVYSEALFLLTLVGAALAFRTQHWMMRRGWRSRDDRDARQRRDVSAGARVDRLAAPAQSARDRRVRGSSPRRPDSSGIGSVLAASTTRSAATRSSGTTASRGGATTPAAIRSRVCYAIGTPLVTRPISFLTTERMAPYDTLNALTAAGALLAVPFIWKRLGTGYAAVVVLGLCCCRCRRASTKASAATARCCSRCRFGWDLCKAKPVTYGLMMGFAMFYALGSILFGNVHPLF